jgi:tRNA (guanine37-N1)-methyltransferase
LVTPYLGNSKTIVKKYKLKGDRIIMNLPETAYSFLSTAKNSLKKGGVIHLYGFSDKRDVVKNVEKEFKIIRKVDCGDYAPGVTRMCFDLKL